MPNPLIRAARQVSVSRKATSTTMADFDWWDDRGWSIISGSGGDHPKSFTELVRKGARSNPVVAACLRVLTSACSEAPLHSYLETADPDLEMSWEPLPRDHPAEELLEFPNSRDSRLTLVTRGVTHYLLSGNNFWWKRRDGFGLVNELISLRPDRVIRAKTDDYNNVISYTVLTDDLGRTIEIPSEDIIHIFNIDPLNEVFGLPPLMAASADIAMDNEASKYVAEILTNHGNPGLLIGVAPETRAERIREAEASWTEKFGPGRGRGKVGFVPGASTVKEIGFNLQELEFPDLRNVTRESICAVFGVDPLFVGIGSAARGSTLSGAEQEEARRKLWMGTVVPLIKVFEQQLNRHLAVEFGDDIGIFFDTERVTALQENRNTAMERGERMVNMGVFTFGEIRSETGYSPELEPEDVVIQKTGVMAVPAEEILEPPEVIEPTLLPPAAEEEEEEEEVALADYPTRRLASGT